MNRRIFLTAAAVFAAGTISSLAHAETVHCGGTNACRGQSACKGANNACKGLNGCKANEWPYDTSGHYIQGPTER